MSALTRQERGQVQANLTPMIDVTFLLIVFFVLVSQIVEVENVDLNLPAPREPASVLPGALIPALLPNDAPNGQHFEAQDYAE